jgi:hypothetical protein
VGATVVSDAGGFALADIDVAVTCAGGDAPDGGDGPAAPPHDPEDMALPGGG